MPVALRCPCGNLTFSLATPPQPVPTPPAFPSSIKRFGRAELTVAGAKWVWEVLVETKSVAPEWRVTRCLNCHTECYAQRIGTQELLVNAELRPREEQAGQAGGLHWSAALGVAVETNVDVSNSLLEAPEVMDDRAVELFQALQRVVESHVGAHTAAVQERIRAFEEEQREALSAYTINAYRDRKVLWHNICQALARRHAPPSAVLSSSPSPSSAVTSAVSSVPAPAAAISTSASSAAAPLSAATSTTTGAAATGTGGGGGGPSVPVSPGPASQAVAEWLRASSSAAPLVAMLNDSDSPRVPRPVPPSLSPPPASSTNPTLSSSSSITSNTTTPPSAPAPSTPAPASAALTSSLSASGATTTTSGSSVAAEASAPMRLPSPRPRGGYGGQGQLSRPVMLASSAPAARSVLAEGEGAVVFRLEEDDAAPEPAAPPLPDDDDDAQTTAALAPQRARAGLRELPAVAVAARAELLFGTSVPISIPPPRTSAAAAGPASGAAKAEEEEASFDVPLSSTRRMKGFL